MTKKIIRAPKAKRTPKEMTIHGDTRIDNYYWLRDRENQEVIDYLRAENEYLGHKLAHTKDLQDQVYQEIIGRIKQTDMSVPYLENGYYYFTRYEEGKEYAIHARKKGSQETKEEVMLDVNELAKDHAYYAIGGISVSLDNRILAFGEDTVSRRIYTLRFKNLETGDYLEDEIPNTTGRAVWANDNQTIFYSRKDDALRPFKIFKHKLGTDSNLDEEIYHEADERFITYVYKSKSKKYIIIGSAMTISNEYRILEADDPDGDFRVFQKREDNLEYNIAHFEDKFFVLTNKEAQNFRLMSTPEGATTKEYWKEVIPHRKDVLLEDIDIFKDFLVLSERINGISQIRVRPWFAEDHYIEFGEEAFMAYTTTNLEFDTKVLRLGFNSLTTPHSVF